jgi:hypothetical protein
VRQPTRTTPMEGFGASGAGRRGKHGPLNEAGGASISSGPRIRALALRRPLARNDVLGSSGPDRIGQNREHTMQRDPVPWPAAGVCLLTSCVCLVTSTPRVRTRSHYASRSSAFSERNTSDISSPQWKRRLADEAVATVSTPCLALTAQPSRLQMPPLGLRPLLASCNCAWVAPCQHRRDNESLPPGLRQSSRGGVLQVVVEEQGLVIT